jgi:low affinity Fe/Cu permease
MANTIDLIVGEGAERQIAKLISDLTQVNELILQTAQSAAKLGSASTPSGAGNSSTENGNAVKQMRELSAEVDKYEKKLLELVAAKNKYTDSALKERTETTLARREAVNQIKSTSIMTSAYEKLDIEHKQAMKSAQALGATYGATSQQFLLAAEKANLLDAKLKEIDSKVGKNTRNVGNYKSGFDSLGNSINQLTREAPAFAVSMNTGFLALSNNIPIFTDEIVKLKKANLDLNATGKPSVSIFKSLASSIFTWQTAISLAVTLLTVYGAKLIDYVFNTDAAEKATVKLTESLKDNSEQIKRNISDLENQASADIELAKQRGASEKELAAIRLKAGLDSVTELEKNNNELISKLDEFDSYRLLKAQDISLAFLSLRKKYNGDNEKAQKEYIRRENEFTDENRKLILEDKIKSDEELRKQNNKNTQLALENLTNEKDEDRKIREKANEDNKKNNEERLKDIFEANKKELEIEQYKKESIIDAEFSTYKEKEKALLEYNDIRQAIINLSFKEEIRLAEGDYNKLQLANLDYQLAILKQTQDSFSKLSTIKKNEEAKKLAEYKAVLKLLTDEEEKAAEITEALEQSKTDAILRSFKAIDKQIDEQIAKTEEAKKAVENYLGSFVTEFAANSGFSETFDILTGKIEGFGTDVAVTFNAIAESAQEAFNFISNASQNNFEGEKKRLQEQYDLAIGFAGDSSSAKAKLADDLEKKQNEIANREAKAKKKQALFNIAIDTAQAIASALPNVPLSIAVALLGGIQLAMVSAQEVPKFFAGGEHDGGLMLVNDGKEFNFRETVVTPDGNILKPQGKNVLMDAPKGTQIYTDAQWQEQELRAMLESRGISMNSSINSNGMTANEMDGVLAKHFSKIQTNHTTFDKKGFSSWAEANGNRTIKDSNRVSRTGFKV